MFFSEVFIVLLTFCCYLTDGYLFSVGRSSDINACLTDDCNASVAFVNEFWTPDFRAQIRALYYPDYTKVDSFGLLGKNNAFKYYDCNLSTANAFYCPWKIINLEKIQNMNGNIDMYPPVADFRWHDIPVSVSEGDFRSQLWRSKEWRVHYSILAKGDIQFLISNHSALETGYNINIGEEAAIYQYCSNLNPDPEHKKHWLYEPKCEKLNSAHVSNVIDGRRWNLFTVEFGINELDYLSINSHKTLLLSNKVIASTTASNSDRFAFRIDGIGIVKPHNYYVLRPKNTDPAWMESLLVITDKSREFCADVVYHINPSMVPGREAFIIELINKNIKRSHRVAAGDSPNISHQWHTERIEYQLEPAFVGETVMKLTVLEPHVTIGGIKFCTRGDTVIKPKNHYTMTDCHSLSNHLGSNQEANNTKSVDIVTKNWKLCEDLDFDDCSGIMACQAKSCKCFAGFLGHTCEKRCEPPTFGSDCKSVSQSKCKNNKMSLNNGTCLENCASETLKYPECIDEIISAVPFIVLTGVRKIVLGMNDSLIDVTSYHHIEVQYKKSLNKDSSEWQTKNYFKSDGPLFYLENLEPQTLYTIRLILHEAKEYKQNLLPGKEKQAQTKPCVATNTTLIRIEEDKNKSSFIRFFKPSDDHCEPKSMDIINIATNTVNKIQIKNGFNFQIRYTPCKLDVRYSVTVVYEDNNKFHTNFICDPQQKLVETVFLVPIAADVGIRKIVLNMNESLRGIAEFDHIDILCKDIDGVKKEIYTSSNREPFVLEGLEQNMLYKISMTLYKTKGEYSGPGNEIEVLTKLCLPIDSSQVEIGVNSDQIISIRLNASDIDSLNVTINIIKKSKRG
ncbi:Hypothetical predicted protein [Cloeon dipterum]|uniref:EGF-like domain-containing protein n=1 Tax=Cloeon dipterum TaxID=197152 RepID=A0A8S1E8X6_9INSE|nr:Hypothetical predicted protein [Cloeon dipterum]